MIWLKETCGDVYVQQVLELHDFWLLEKVTMQNRIVQAHVAIYQRIRTMKIFTEFFKNSCCSNLC